jgi:RimJ/RimL family protein N-acetyltransferase
MFPDLQPTLEGERITLRPLHPSYFEALFLAASDPLIWEQHPFPDRYKREVFEKFFTEALASKGAFAIIEQASQAIIGSSRYYDSDLTKSSIVIGYTFLTRKFWGGSYNREMKQLMIDHAFRFFTAIQFHVGIENIRSQKAMEKFAGSPIGKMLKARDDGGTRTSLIYEIHALR